MTTDKISPNFTGNRQDNLGTIIGIGPKTAEALSHIGIHRFADLAQSTPEGLAKALFDQLGFRASPKHIEAQNWIGQAQARVQQSASLPVDQCAAVSETQSGELVESGGALSQTHRQQYAGFALFFDYVLYEEGKQDWQTRVYHAETAEEQLFPGTAPEQWVNWILQHADLPGEVSAAFREQPATQITFTDLLVDAKTLPGVPEKVLVADIRFALAGAKAEALASAQTAYQLMLHTADLNSGLIRLVATVSSQFQPGQFEYGHQLEFPIPNVGRYELQCIFLASAPTELVASYRGPSVRVMP